jgi:signal transduction histidine kinase/CheY-like chemotaxis protein
MSLSEVLSYLAVVSAGGLGVFVFLRRPPEPIWPSLFFVVASAFVWALGEALTSFVVTTPFSYWVALVFQYVGVLWLPPVWWLFALGFAELQGRPVRWAGSFVKYAPLGIAAMLWIALLTNSWHGEFLVPHLDAPNDYRVGWYIQAGLAYFLLVAVSALFLWLRWTMRRSTVRRQLDIMLAATLISPVFNLLYVTRTVDVGFDITVVSFVVATAIFVFGIYRHQLWVLSPITLQHLIRGDRDGLLILDGIDQLLHANPAAEELLGSDVLRPHTEVFPILAERIVPEGAGGAAWSLDQLRETLLTQDDSPTGHVYKFRHPTHQWVRIEATPIPDRKGRDIGMGLRLIDITDVKRAEEERKNFEGRVQHAQKLESLGVLAGGIAHDFNNLLMAILGNAELALREMSGESTAREAIVEIEKASLRASALCRQMLAYAGKGNFVVGPIDLNGVVEELVHLLRTSIGKKAVLNLHLGSDLPPINADASQLQQVVMNLITNASESLGEVSGKITITTGVEECDQTRLSLNYLQDDLPDGQYVFLRVADTGCGMNLDTQEKVFEPFFSSKFTGRGLGLSAVLGIIRGHSGAIILESSLGHGTTFEVLFPALPPGPPTPRGRASESPDEWHGSGTILLVDDEAAVRDVGARMLQALGFVVLTAEDGFQALDLYGAHRDEIVCVVLDLTMPKMDGYETIHRLQAIGGHVPIVLASGFGEDDVSARVEAGAVAGFIPKPYRLAMLEDRLRRVLDR